MTGVDVVVTKDGERKKASETERAKPTRAIRSETITMQGIT